MKIASLHCRKPFKPLDPPEKFPSGTRITDPDQGGGMYLVICPVHHGIQPPSLALPFPGHCCYRFPDSDAIIDFEID